MSLKYFRKRIFPLQRRDLDCYSIDLKMAVGERVCAVMALGASLCHGISSDWIAAVFFKGTAQTTQEKTGK